MATYNNILSQLMLLNENIAAIVKELKYYNATIEEMLKEEREKVKRERGF